MGKQKKQQPGGIEDNWWGNMEGDFSGISGRKTIQYSLSCCLETCLLALLVKKQFTSHGLGNASLSVHLCLVCV